MSRSTKAQRLIALFAVLALTAALAARHLEVGTKYPQAIGWLADLLPAEDAVPAGFAVANGRIEATEVDIATKLPGRIEVVLADEGDVVEAGDVVARMDTRTLDAELEQAEAELRRAHTERAHAEAVVVQQRAERDFQAKELVRFQALALKGSVSFESLDQRRSMQQVAQARLQAAQIKVAQSQAEIDAAQATVKRVKVELDETTLVAPRRGRVLYRLAEPGEMLAAGGKIMTLLDLSDVYMTVFMPETVAGRIPLGADARMVLDAAPDVVIPARVVFVSPQAQFTPKQVETRSEREKLSFRVKVAVDPELAARYENQVKSGVPGVSYVRLNAADAWPQHLEVRLP
ncbi:MAG: HlyD family secretion protein [Gammaproteobacteria bacterium]